MDTPTVVKPKYATSTWYYQNVPEFREKVKQWSKESHQRRKEANPEAVKEANRKSSHSKYHNDPEYRERQIQRAKERYYKKKAEREAQVSLGQLPN